MTPYIQDADFTLWQGDVREVLAQLEPDSVDCVITSPPYWGLRDYGTGAWDGGDDACDHEPDRTSPSSTLEGGKATQGAARVFRDVCGKCGATRVDQQLGLEPTPDEFVTNIVQVFREVRRVLAPHGTCWVNLGDSYNNRNVSRQSSHQTGLGFNSSDLQKSWVELRAEGRARMSIDDGTLKEKDLCGIPWRVALALQADGWYLRSDIIWSKPNPMPESVTDRPTKAHEYIFLLTKRPRYWFDQEAVREDATSPPGSRAGYAGYSKRAHAMGREPSGNEKPGAEAFNGIGRNVRSVWEIATQPYAEAHFATYPQELVRRCLLAGCPEFVCRTCGKPRERIVEREVANRVVGGKGMNGDRADGGMACNADRSYQTVGWSDCGHHNYRAGVVLDPFMGSGTTALVARNHGRHAVGVELNPEYCELIARRLQQLSLLTEDVA